jgi:hypothetical protein
MNDLTLDNHIAGSTRTLTADWGPSRKVSLYLDRCQVDTPPGLVEEIWRLVLERRRTVGKVVDFGAGDARFARAGRYREYVGYEIDRRRLSGARLPEGAVVRHACSFSTVIEDADVCIGNPPFVRNQDLPVGWRTSAAAQLRHRTGIELSGLANAWQYFFLLSLVSLKKDGLAALVVPFEWVTRPSAKRLRQYINNQGWNVDVYRLSDKVFDRVLTTSSITLIDKRARQNKWRYFLEIQPAKYRALKTPTAGKRRPLEYRRAMASLIRAKRGLSPGTQEVLVLSERDRARFGLKRERDVVPCVTSLRHVNDGLETLSWSVFCEQYVDPGKKCWLIRTDLEPSANLRAYLGSIPASKRSTATCTARSDWWRFVMPQTPQLLIASGFRGVRPKVISNKIGARAIGGVTGIYCSRSTVNPALRALRAADLRGRIVAHSNGLKKVEVNQVNALLGEFASRR